MQAEAIREKRATHHQGGGRIGSSEKMASGASAGCNPAAARAANRLQDDRRSEAGKNSPRVMIPVDSSTLSKAASDTSARARLLRATKTSRGGDCSDGGIYLR